MKVECVSTFSAKRSEAKRPIWRSALRDNVNTKKHDTNLSVVSKSNTCLSSVAMVTDVSDNGANLSDTIDINLVQ